ncbi:hypothetical protein NDU88_003092 [Pleurodeles waltl]|uniref:Uncharacterized protein n=1 Tax=Pleurodeles waltl TaxID=8319 RepID=A0AAV7UE77_PLEWA|nr:hypothetical protein NDU88_003092 [Pleurodeles waltl]
MTASGGDEDPKGTIGSGQNCPGHREGATGHRPPCVDHWCAASTLRSRPGGGASGWTPNRLELANCVGQEHLNRWAPAGGAPIGPGSRSSDVAGPAGMNNDCGQREARPTKRDAPSLLGT